MAKEERPKEKKSKGKGKSKGKSKGKAASQETAAAPGVRAAVVASVAAFLDSGGFPRTLAALQSEADLEAGSWGSSPVNLEELVSKFLDSCNSTPVAVTVGSNDQDGKTDNITEDAGKKKKVKKGGADDDKSRSKADEPSVHEKPSESAAGETKEKKQKKKDGSSEGNAGSGEANGTVMSNDQKLDCKKKKSKEEKNDDIESRLDKAILAIKNKFEAAEKLDEEQPKRQNDDADKNSLGDGALDKAKKKKKGKSAAETSERIDSGAAPAEAAGSGAVEAVKDDNEKKSKKKRKRSDPEEVAGKDTISKPDDENKSGMEIEGGENGKPSSENVVAGKKRKLEEVEGSNPPAKENGTANQSLNHGFPEDNTKEDSNIKSSKKQKHSSEPKTVNAFQRVKLEDVKFADERLQDNSYWAKSGADSGYGAKAQEVLGQVRGRGFRHEKTKKKRGTYRGGQIDFQTHSIKLNDSDDE